MMTEDAISVAISRMKSSTCVLDLIPAKQFKANFLSLPGNNCYKCSEFRSHPRSFQQGSGETSGWRVSITLNSQKDASVSLSSSFPAFLSVLQPIFSGAVDITFALIIRTTLTGWRCGPCFHPQPFGIQANESCKFYALRCSLHIAFRGMDWNGPGQNRGKEMTFKIIRQMGNRTTSQIGQPKKYLG